MVKMKHAEHGFTHAYTLAEQQELEKRGWLVETPETPQEKPKGKPGRKPKNPQ